MQPLRWGILGAARIARQNWKAIFHSGTARVTAVAARKRSSAEAFVAAAQAEFPFPETPTVFDSYAELLASREVDAVYIPLPTGTRKEWVIRAAEAGKHVLCEKPCALNAADLREMIAACARHRVQFMDGVMFMHSPRLASLRAALDDPDGVGPLRRITSMFSFSANPAEFASDIRVQAALEPAGCLGDLGWYCLRFSLFAQRWKLPVTASGRILALAADGVTPTQFSGELHFADGVSAGFYCAFVTDLQQWAVASGTKGSVTVPDFIHPRNSYEPAFDLAGKPVRVAASPGIRVPSDPGSLGEFGHPTAQDTRMFVNFAAQVQSGTLSTFWPEVALKTQIVMDACLASARAEGRCVELPPFEL